MERVKEEYGKRAYFYSFLIHAALLVLMLNTPVKVEVEAPRFYEMTLGSLTRERLEQIVTEARRAEEARRMRNRA